MEPLLGENKARYTAAWSLDAYLIHALEGSHVLFVSDGAGPFVEEVVRQLMGRFGNARAPWEAFT